MNDQLPTEGSEIELERVRLDLERRQVEAEIEQRSRELSLQERRFAIESSRPWYSANLPWLGPTLGALVGIGTLFINQILERQNHERIAKLESASQRFERESQIILQATDGVTQERAISNLEFYLDAGYLSDNGRLAELIDQNRAPVTNQPSSDCELTPGNPVHDVLIEDHLLTGVALCPTPNTGGELAGGAAKYVVIHFSSNGSLHGAVNWATNPASRTSAHVLIGHDGTPVQIVPFDVQAWHAGRSSWDGLDGLNRYSIAIELVNWGGLRGGSGDWKSWTGTPVDDDRVVEAAHRNSPGRVTGWEVYDEAQISTLIMVLKLLQQEYSIAPEDVIGNDDVAPLRKTDPGPAFPWEEVRAALREVKREAAQGAP